MPRRFPTRHFCFKLARMKILNKMKKTALILPLIFVLSMLSSCTEGIKGVVERPNIQVHKVAMGGFNLSGGTATIILDIQNPNRFSIPLTGFDYGLSLNGVEVAKANKEHKTSIGAGESQKVSVPVDLSFANMMNMAPGLLRDRQVKYDLGGSVHLPWFNIPFNRSGVSSIGL